MRALGNDVILILLRADLIMISDTNEVVCYAAEEHYISDDDSGAPAIRQGHLVAVTLGGVECEGDHVAIGIKMNCFCSWIAENLP
uniref:SFRICE_040435 n=1 Tax=Spodoptera frugiperda TaxID=7108 RepID=A0A2H1VZC0_SPOFR